jgi:hypothetical protein
MRFEDRSHANGRLARRAPFVDGTGATWLPDFYWANECAAQDLEIRMRHKAKVD